MTDDEANNTLREAVDAHARHFGLAEDDELLGDFGVVAYWQRVESDGRSRYSTQFGTDSLPTHIAEGLFRAAVRYCIGCDEEEA